MKKYILIILCCLTSFPLWSYNVNMIVEHYSVDQGLPNNTVNCTLKDRDGFIWFGTWYGLCCFDGVKFKTFNKQEHDSDVPPRKIQRIVEDKNGYIWVKTIDRKLYVFNKVTECFHAVYDDMKNYSENIQVIKLQNTAEYNPQIQISAESETKRSIFREKDKTKRSKKESAQHSKSRNKSFVMTSVSAL